jgi:hypothetical protein
LSHLITVSPAPQYLFTPTLPGKPFIAPTKKISARIFFSLVVALTVMLIMMNGNVDVLVGVLVVVVVVAPNRQQW